MKTVFFALVFLFFFSGLASAQNSEVELSHPVLKYTISEKEILNQTINFINTGSAKHFSIKAVSSAEFFSADAEKLFLEEGGKAGFNVFSERGLLPGVYTGSILITGAEENTIPVVLEVESERPLFDSVLEVIPDGRNNLLIKVKIFNLRSKESTAKLRYQLFDLQGNEIFSEEESIEVLNQAEISKKIDFDFSGKGVFAVTVSRAGSTGTSSEIVDFEDSFGKESVAIYFFIFLFAAFLLFVVILNHYWNRRVKEVSKNWSREVAEIRRIKFGNVSREIRFLERKLSLLETAREKGYIKRSSYAEARREINTLIRKLKKRL